MTELYFEDLAPGQVFMHGGYTITKEHAIAFAKEYDPQYFHIDEEAAKDSMFGKLAVSGWQTAAISMRLKALSDLGKVHGGLIGAGLETVKWPRAVYPGDTLRAVIRILEKRLSKSRPAHGVVRYKMETFNQVDELVMEAVTSVLVARRGN